MRMFAPRLHPMARSGDEGYFSRMVLTARRMSLRAPGGAGEVRQRRKGEACAPASI